MTAETIKRPVDFGPLAEPLHPGIAGPDDPDYRDNAYFGIWSHTEDVFAEVHVSTSPNAFRWARIEVSVNGRTVEINEDCPEDSYRSEHIDFDTNGRLTVRHPDLDVDITYAPRFQPMDYSPKKVMGGLVSDKPLRHYEQGTSVTGTITMRGETVDFDGLGFRDRTWGFRDDSRQWQEYITVWGTFDGFDLTAMKFQDMAGTTIADGFLNSADGSQRRVTEMNFTYTPAGTMKHLRLILDGIEERIVERTRSIGGFWLPMGPRKPEGATCFHAYDDFAELNAWGSPGRGIVAYGIQRML
jgi:hypothetical protein